MRILNEGGANRSARINEQLSNNLSLSSLLSLENFWLAALIDGNCSSHKEQLT